MMVLREMQNWQRVSQFDKRFARDDDWAGDAWQHKETGEVRWTVVGYDMNKVDVFDEFPPAIKVGPFRYAIEVLDEIAKEDDADTAWGDCENLLIRLKREQPSTAFALDTVLHEVGHAIASAFALGDKSDEERAVSVFATGWTMVLQENPALVNWIWRALRNANV